MVLMDPFFLEIKLAKWEYKLVQFTFEVQKQQRKANKSSDEVTVVLDPNEVGLNQYGAEGWELVQLIILNEVKINFGIFKREIIRS